MAAPSRFLFDNDFSVPPPAAAPVVVAPEPEPVEVEPPVPMIEVSLHEAALEAVRVGAYEDGVADGRRATESRAAERVADEASRLVAVARSLLASLEADRNAIEAAAIELAVGVARKLAGALIDREPLDAVRALIADSLGPLRKAPHLVIRLKEQDAEAIRPEVDRMARDNGFEGRIIILGEPDIQTGDCRIEWADGGLVRDRTAMSAAIDDAVASYIAARHSSHDGPVHTDPIRQGKD